MMKYSQKLYSDSVFNGLCCWILKNLLNVLNVFNRFFKEP